MNKIYKIGVVVGIIVIYSLVTWGLAAIITLKNDEDWAFGAFVAWLNGCFAFVALSIFTMEKFGLWMA